MDMGVQEKERGFPNGDGCWEDRVRHALAIDAQYYGSAVTHVTRARSSLSHSPVTLAQD